MKANIFTALLILASSQHLLAAECPDKMTLAMECLGQTNGPRNSDGFDTKVNGYAVVCTDNNGNVQLGELSTGMHSNTPIFYKKTVRDGDRLIGYYNGRQNAVASVLSFTSANSAVFEISGWSNRPINMTCK